MRVVADLQIHSKYSRAVSREMTIPNIAMWAKKKGIDLVATGDWTHPLWLKELQENLTEEEEGIYGYGKIKFLLATEISSIFSQGGRTRRVHTLIWVPSFREAYGIAKEMAKRGCNIVSDGRPIVGLSCKNLAELVWEKCEEAIIIPAHSWTPWFSVFGSSGGFDSLEEAFGEHAKKILAIETGLSSDPAMNWRIKELDNKAIVSFSDAHSLTKLGREATVFELDKISYPEIRQSLEKKKIAYTLEFYPEEGKYHYTGHRMCKVVQTPAETRYKGKICPVCGRNLTVGVMHRVEILAGREITPVENTDRLGVKWYRHPTDSSKSPFVRMVALEEILAEVYKIGKSAKKVRGIYESLIDKLGSELKILMKLPLEKIAKVGGGRLAEGIGKVRCGDIVVRPGYDGEYGVVKIWGENTSETDQQKLFSD